MKLQLSTEQYEEVRGGLTIARGVVQGMVNVQQRANNGGDRREAVFQLSAYLKKIDRSIKILDNNVT